MTYQTVAEEVGWGLTLLVVSTAVSAVLGDLGDIYIVGDDAYVFMPVDFALVLCAALMASRWLVLLGRSGSDGQRRVTRGIMLLVAAGALGTAVVVALRPPVSDVLDWHLNGFPAPRRYPGIQRYQIEALLILRSLVPAATLLVGSLIALRSMSNRAS